MPNFIQLLLVGFLTGIANQKKRIFFHDAACKNCFNSSPDGARILTLGSKANEMLVLVRYQTLRFNVDHC